jgi:hypothetical protein
LVTRKLGTIYALDIRLRARNFAWKEQSMNEPGQTIPPRHPSKGVAGGFFIFVGLIIGSIIGVVYDQPSIGMVGGMASGAIIAVIVWLLDRRKG